MTDVVALMLVLVGMGMGEEDELMVEGVLLRGALGGGVVGEGVLSVLVVFVGGQGEGVVEVEGVTGAAASG